MLRFKKLISALVSATMLLTVMATSVFAAVPSDVIGTEYEEAAQLLGVLDIMVGDKETGSFRPEDTIIRSEGARVAISALGLQSVADTSNGPTKYPDVVENHWANGFINVATNQNLVVGDDVGTFRPDDTISYAEFVTIMVRALGYEPQALSKGGFPTGYLVTASNIGLTKGVPGNADDGINRGDVARIVFNAMTIKLMEQVGFGNNISYEVVDKTLLKEYLEVDKITGQVLAVGTSAINGDSNLRDDQIQIDDKIYSIGEADVREILGFNVDAYIRENNSGEKILLLARPVDGLNDSVKVDADDIEEIVNEEDSKVLRYWVDKENDRNPKKLTIATDAKVMYNGKAGSFDDFKMISSGSITVLDSDSNGEYDIVFVNETVNYVVEEVYENTHKIVDKYGQKTLVLDPEDTNLTFSIAKGSEFINLSDLSEWDVLTVTQSKDEDFIYIEVSNEKVTGKVTEKDDEKVYIDGQGYRIASNYANSIDLNDEGTFYLDVQGKIAAVDADATISTNYAYLNTIQKAAGIEKALELELFTKDGERKLLKTATKIRVNGKSNMTPDEALSAIGQTAQLITFEVNSDGNVHRINTATDTSGNIDEDNFSKNLTLDDAVFKSASNKLVKDGKSVTVTDETVVFDIPTGKTDTTDYSVRDLSFFVNDDTYNVVVFDMQEDLTAGVIIVTSSTGEADEASDVLVVDRITQVKDEDGMDIEKLYAVQGGKTVTYTTEETGILVKQQVVAHDDEEEAEVEEVALQQGDIIQVKTNIKGQIEKVTVLFDISAKDTEATTEISEDSVTYYGKVEKKFPTSFNLSVNDGDVMNFAIGTANIYRVDTTKNSNQVTIGDAGDIQKYDDADPERVFVRVYKDEVKDIIIIK